MKAGFRISGPTSTSTKARSQHRPIPRQRAGSVMKITRQWSIVLCSFTLRSSPWPRSLERTSKPRRIPSPHELAAEALHIWWHRRRNWIECANPFTSAGYHGAGYSLFEVTNLAFRFVHAVAAQVSLERGHLVGHGLIASVEADQQPDVSLEFVLVHTLALFKKLAQMLLGLGQTLHGGFAEPVRSFGVVIVFQPDPAQQVLPKGIALVGGFLKPRLGRTQVSRNSTAGVVEPSEQPV